MIGEDTNRGHAEAFSTPHRHRPVHPEVPVERKAEGVQENEQQQPDQAVVGGGGLVLHQVHDEPDQQDHVQQTPQNGDGEERAKQVQDICCRYILTGFGEPDQIGQYAGEQLDQKIDHQHDGQDRQDTYQPAVRSALWRLVLIHSVHTKSRYHL